MKKTLAVILALILVVALAACGNNGGNEKTTTTEAPASQGSAETVAPVTSDDYSFTYKGVNIYIGQKADEAVEALKDYQKGEPTATASCAFEGDDYKYFYGSFYMCTGTLNGEDIVDAFWFVDDTVETGEGLAIGDGKDKVEELYGSDGFNGVNAYVLKGDLAWLTIILEGDSVSSIQYVYQGQLQ